MKLEQGKFCPLIGKDCIGLQCSWFTQMRGQHPQTGAPVDEWGCAVTWMPLLTVENAQMERQTGAAVESFRNEMVKNNETNRDLLSQTITNTQNIIPTTVYVEQPKLEGDTK